MYLLQIIMYNKLLYIHNYISKYIIIKHNVNMYIIITKIFIIINILKIKTTHICIMIIYKEKICSCSELRVSDNKNH